MNDMKLKWRMKEGRMSIDKICVRLLFSQLPLTPFYPSLFVTAHTRRSNFFNLCVVWRGKSGKVCKSVRNGHNKNGSSLSLFSLPSLLVTDKRCVRDVWFGRKGNNRSHEISHCHTRCRYFSLSSLSHSLSHSHSHLFTLILSFAPSYIHRSCPHECRAWEDREWGREGWESNLRWRTYTHSRTHTHMHPHSLVSSCSGKICLFRKSEWRESSRSLRSIWQRR